MCFFYVGFALAAQLSEKIRDSDICCRLGGEGFGLVLLSS